MTGYRSKKTRMTLSWSSSIKETNLFVTIEGSPKYLSTSKVIARVLLGSFQSCLCSQSMDSAHLEENYMEHGLHHVSTTTEMDVERQQ